MKLYTITYTINGKTVTSKGHTAEGVKQLMNAICKAGGTGYSIEQ